MHDAPEDFTAHCERIARLVDEVGDPALRTDLFRAIERLVMGLNAEWLGCRVAWSQRMPDTIEALVD